MSSVNRILIHDYAGHPFQVHLSRMLAGAGHQVLHLYADGNPTPKGPLNLTPNDPPTLEIERIPVNLGRNRYQYVSRWMGELRYGRRLRSFVESWRPDIVISCNTPLNPQLSLMKATHRSGAAFVFWVQDLLGYGIRRILANRWGRAGEFAGQYFERLEKRIGRHSDAIVLITRDFMPYVTPWAAAEEKFSIIQNWAEIEQMPVCPEENAWKTAAGLAGRTCFTYTGTMGLKHNAEHLVHLARHFRTKPEVAIVVVSEGLGADWLREKKAELGLNNLHLLGFQPYDRMPMVLGASSALIATLEEDAGVFAVPSKVLNYLCAGRPILLAVPSGNLSARLVAEAGAGYGYPPSDVEGFLAAAGRIAADPDLRRELGANGRRYAEINFTPEIVLRQFASVINAVRPRTHEAVSETSALARS